MLDTLTPDEIRRLIELEVTQGGRDDVSWPALKHLHGAKDECALVAVCCALEIDLDTESHRYEIENGISLGEAARKANWSNFRTTKTFLDGLWQKDCMLFFKSNPISAARTWEMTPDLGGVGVMTARNSNNGERHAVAYQDGWVYDGNAPSPLRYSVWAMGVGDNVVVDGMSTKKETK